MSALISECRRLLVGLIVLAAASIACAEPQIRIGVVPKAKAGGESTDSYIEGTVSGVAPASYWVVIYSQSDRGVWYVQPFENNPYTAIQNDKHWRARIHPGMVYAALLVKKDSVCKGSATDKDCFKPLTEVATRPTVQTEVEVQGQ